MSLSKLVDNLSEELHRDQCTDCKLHFDYMSIKDNQLIFRFLGVKRILKKTLIKN